MIETYLSSFDLCFFELSEAFSGLANDNVWKRPADGLLSIGEIAGHIAYWYAGRFGGVGKDGSGKPDLDQSRVKSVLLDERFSYFTTSIDKDPVRLELTAQQVMDELTRLHKECSELLRNLNPGLEEQVPGWPSGQNYKSFFEYGVFHVAYHTGQIYSARHLLGEVPPDN